MDIYPSESQGSIALILYEVVHGEVRTCRNMNHGPQSDINDLTLGVVEVGLGYELGVPSQEKGRDEGRLSSVWFGLNWCRGKCGLMKCEGEVEEEVEGESSGRSSTKLSIV